jgi:hypothetical protein
LLGWLADWLVSWFLVTWAGEEPGQFEMVRALALAHCPLLGHEVLLAADCNNHRIQVELALCQFWFILVFCMGSTIAQFPSNVVSL